MTDTAVETPAQAESTEVEAKPAKKVVEPTPCACQFYSGTDAKGQELSTGCDEETVRTFRPGHDAKLKSLLIKVASAGNSVTKRVGDGTEEMDPLHAAEEFGFRGLVEKSVNAANEKQAARDAKAKEREEAKAAKERAKAEAKAERERKAAQKKAHADAVAKAAEERKGQPGPATAKVGRSTFDGEILADGQFRYTKGDEEVETSNYSVVVDPASVPVPDVDAN